MIEFNGIEYPDDFSREQFENNTDVPAEIIERHFKSMAAKKNRINAYPPIEEQLDYIYHHGVDRWKSEVIDPIKEKYTLR